MSSRFCANLLGVAAWLALSVGVAAAAAGAAGSGFGVSADARGTRAVLDEARRAYESRQVDRAETLFRHALKLATSERLTREQAEALLGIGRIELEGDLRTAAKGSLERALTLFETAGDTTGHAQVLAASGQTLVLLGDAEEGVRRVETAVDTLRARVDATRGDATRDDATRADEARGDGGRVGGARGDRAPGDGAPGDGARDDVEALARASAILISVMPPGPAKDSARDALAPALRDARHRPRRRNARIVPRPAWRERQAEHRRRRGHTR